VYGWIKANVHWDITPEYNVDAIIEAVHREAVLTLVPFVRYQEAKSWYYSQYILNGLMCMLHDRDRFCTNALRAINVEHDLSDNRRLSDESWRARRRQLYAQREMDWSVPYAFLRDSLTPSGAKRFCKSISAHNSLGYDTSRPPRQTARSMHADGTYVVPDAFLHEVFRADEPLLVHWTQWRARDTNAELFDAITRRAAEDYALYQPQSAVKVASAEEYAECIQRATRPYDSSGNASRPAHTMPITNGLGSAGTTRQATTQDCLGGEGNERTRDGCRERGKPVVVWLSQGPGTKPPEWMLERITRNDTVAVWGTYAGVAQRDKAGTCGDPTRCFLWSVAIPGTTWTTGRNALYEAARRKLGGTVCYYVFADDDIEFKYRSDGPGSGAALTSQSARTPCAPHEPAPAYFERLLRTDQPAIAAVTFELPRSNYLHACNECNHRPKLHDQCASDFDAIVNAIRYDTATVMLPYEPKFDNNSWWTSQVVFIDMAYLAYARNAVEYGQLFVNNNLHREYPRSASWGTEVYDVSKALLAERLGADCLQRLLAELPSEYANFGYMQRQTIPLKRKCELGWGTCRFHRAASYGADWLCGENHTRAPPVSSCS
jgi:hypothetical protein